MVEIHSSSKFRSHSNSNYNHLKIFIENSFERYQLYKKHFTYPTGVWYIESRGRGLSYETEKTYKTIIEN